ILFPGAISLKGKWIVDGETARVTVSLCYQQSVSEYYGQAPPEQEPPVIAPTWDAEQFQHAKYRECAKHVTCYGHCVTYNGRASRRWLRSRSSTEQRSSAPHRKLTLKQTHLAPEHSGDHRNESDAL